MALCCSTSPGALLLTHSRNKSTSPSLLKVLGGKWRGISMLEIQMETLSLQFFCMLQPLHVQGPSIPHSQLAGLPALCSPFPPHQAPFLSSSLTRCGHQSTPQPHTSTSALNYYYHYRGPFSQQRNLLCVGALGGSIS